MTSYSKTAVITGAYGGLGKSLVNQYLNNGYSVHMIGRNKNRLLELEEHLKTVHPTATIKSYECDLMDCYWIKSVCDMIKMETNSIDVLINCAAIFPVGSVSDTSIRSFERCMQINVTAPFIIIQQLLSHIVSSENGKIINIASSSAYGGGPNTSAYCASKHALLGLSRSLFKELKSDGIKVFCVSPGS